MSEPDSSAIDEQTFKAHIKATHNNVMVSIANEKGDVLCWASAGSCGYKGARKSTYPAGYSAAQRSAVRSRELGVHAVTVQIKGEGPAVDGALAGLRAGGLEVIADT